MHVLSCLWLCAGRDAHCSPALDRAVLLREQVDSWGATSTLWHTSRCQMYLFLLSRLGKNESTKVVGLHHVLGTGK